MTMLDLSESEDEDDDRVDPEDLPPALAKGERNSQLTVGYKGDRSYVVRGNNIGVFHLSPDDNQIKYYSSMTQISTPKGKQFRPQNVRVEFLVIHIITKLTQFADHVARSRHQNGAHEPVGAALALQHGHRAR